MHRRASMRCRWRDGKTESGVFSLPGRRAVSASVYDLESTRIDQRHIGSGGDMDACGRIGRLYLVTPTGADDVPPELSFIYTAAQSRYCSNSPIQNSCAESNKGCYHYNIGNLHLAQHRVDTDSSRRLGPSHRWNTIGSSLTHRVWATRRYV